MVRVFPLCVLVDKITSLCHLAWDSSLCILGVWGVCGREGEGERVWDTKTDDTGREKATPKSI